MSLRLGDDGGGRRYYLAGRPVHNGDVLEIRLVDGDWLRVRIEHLPEDPTIYVWVGRTFEATTRVPRDAFLRWPPRA